MHVHFYSVLSALWLVVAPRVLNARDFLRVRVGMLMKRMVEHCRNPWNGRCENADIEVYIYYKGRRLAICSTCWANIADKNLEW